MARSATTGLMMIFGVLFLLWSILVLGASSYIYDDMGIILMCNSVDFLLTFLLLGGWYIRKTKEDKLDEIASYLSAYRRTHIDKVAKKMNLDSGKAEKLMLECISKKLISGYLDRNTGEFILSESINEMKSGTKCPNCGGYSADVSFPGEIVKCQFCSAVISNDDPPPPPPPIAQPTPRPSSGGRIMLCSRCRKEIPLDSNLCPYCGNTF